MKNSKITAKIAKAVKLANSGKFATKAEVSAIKDKWLASKKG